MKITVSLIDGTSRVFEGVTDYEFNDDFLAVECDDLSYTMINSDYIVLYREDPEDEDEEEDCSDCSHCGYCKDD